MRATRTRNIVTAGLMTALLSASAFVAIPVGAVPITLQTFIVVLAALLLEPLWAGASVLAYLVLGAAGLPVFSGGHGGLGVLAGPTGGYLIGFAVGAVMGALLRRSLQRSGGHTVLADVVCGAMVLGATYAMGTTQLALVAGLDPKAAIMAGVVPFVAIDAAKAFVAVGAASAIRRARGESATVAFGYSGRR